MANFLDNILTEKMLEVSRMIEEPIKPVRQTKSLVQRLQEQPDTFSIISLLRH